MFQHSISEIDTIRILIIVQSAPEMFDRRKSNRDSWIKYANEHYNETVKILFLFGKTGNSKVTTLNHSYYHELKIEIHDISNLLKLVNIVLFITFICLIY